MKVKMRKFQYKYMEYEKRLCEREIQTLFPGSMIMDSGSLMNVEMPEDSLDESKLSRLTYIEAYCVNGQWNRTTQGNIELEGQSGTGKQHTRYSTHGLHEYKGKFNPQIVKCIMNLFEIDESKRVFDPFCGSGTTIVECAQASVSACGTDINPMACFIANAKVNALRIDIQKAMNTLKRLRARINNPSYSLIIEETERLSYLRKWIPERNLALLESIREELADCPTDITNLFLVIASDLIRDYSYQEPADLRIRKRTSPFPETPMGELFLHNSERFLERIISAQEVLGESNVDNLAINCDIKTAKLSTDSLFDVAITSPPYVNALPYIDTQRISLVWLDLCDPKEILKLESTLIGNRELLKAEKERLKNAINTNSAELPDEIVSFVHELDDSLDHGDGFRKQAVPSLLYRYFADMKQMFLNVRKVIKKDGKYALVVGYNKTTLGGKTFRIDTPYLLSVLAENSGWSLDEIIPLQTYKRYGLNCKNAINQESLIILSKAA